MLFVVTLLSDVDSLLLIFVLLEVVLFVFVLLEVLLPLVPLVARTLPPPDVSKVIVGLALKGQGKIKLMSTPEPPAPFPAQQKLSVPPEFSGSC